MTTISIDDFTPEEFNQFRYLIGCMLFKLPAVSVWAGHVKPLDTVRDYLDLEEDRVDKVRVAARRYLVEFSRATTREETMALAVRWHGPNPRSQVANELANSIPSLNKEQ